MIWVRMGLLSLTLPVATEFCIQQCIFTTSMISGKTVKSSFLTSALDHCNVKDVVVLNHNLGIFYTQIHLEK
jgi:hypothetical protein